MSKRVPQLREHRGRSRVTFDGKDYYCGSWDTKRDRPSPAAIQEYDRLLGRWLVGGREMPVAPSPGRSPWFHASASFGPKRLEVGQ